MGNSAKDARNGPRGWLWLARGATAFFFLASALIEVPLLDLALENAPGHWHEGRHILWFTAFVTALCCGLVPYVLVAWNCWRERTRIKGQFQALVIGSFWLFAGWIMPADLAFHGVPGFGSTRTPANYADLMEVSLIMFVVCTLPALLLLISGMKLVNFYSTSNAVAAAPDPGRHTFTLRVALGTVLALLLVPAVLGLFTLRQRLPVLYLTVIETWLLVTVIPHTMIWRNLHKGRHRSPAPNPASALATGLLAFIAMGGLTFGLLPWGMASSRPHQMSTKVELAFFALLGLANIALLLAGRRDGREAEEAGGEKRFDWGALAISLCLVVSVTFMMLISASI